MSSHRGGTWGVFIKSTGGGRREGFGGQSEIRWQEIGKIGKNLQQSFLKEKGQRGANHSSHTHTHNELSGNRRSSRGNHVESPENNKLCFTCLNSFSSFPLCGLAG